LAEWWTRFLEADEAGRAHLVKTLNAPHPKASRRRRRRPGKPKTAPAASV
jgi:hypothetical protein